MFAFYHFCKYTLRIEITYKLVKGVFQYFCFLDRAKKGVDILDFQEGGILEKGGGYEPSYQLWSRTTTFWQVYQVVSFVQSDCMAGFRLTYHKSQLESILNILPVFMNFMYQFLISPSQFSHYNRVLFYTMSFTGKALYFFTIVSFYLTFNSKLFIFISRVTADKHSSFNNGKKVLALIKEINDQKDCFQHYITLVCISL